MIFVSSEIIRVLMIDLVSDMFEANLKSWISLKILLLVKDFFL